MSKNLNEPGIALTGGDWSLNLRRLLYFHHATAREAATIIGVTEQAISGWLRGTRTQSLQVAIRVAEIYDIDPRSLGGDPLDFAERLGDRERIERAEANIEAIKKKLRRKVVEEHRAKKRGATVTKLQPRRKG